MALRASQHVLQPTKELDFFPTESPPWREGPSLPEISTMLSQVDTWHRDMRGWKREQLAFVGSTFHRRKVVEFVILSNQMEQEGTQDSDSTEELVLTAMGEENLSKKTLSEVQRATIQTYQAMNHLFLTRVEMSKEAGSQAHETLFLTVDLIKSTHRVLMDRLISNPGEFRTSEAYPSGCDSFYVASASIEARLESLLDTYNSILEEVKDLSCGVIFKLAAWFLYHFLTLHPFSDGNGRLARILANSILFLHVPFPVALKPRAASTTTASDAIEQWRRHYINAIVECREDVQLASKHRPRALAALVVQSAWDGWRSLSDAFESRGYTAPLGPLVIRQSATISEADLAVKVSKWNRGCDAQSAAAEILAQLRKAKREFSVTLSDDTTLKVEDRTPSDTSPPNIPSVDTILILRRAHTMTEQERSEFADSFCPSKT